VRDDVGIPEGYLATSDVNPEAEFFGLSLRWLRRLLEESPVRQQVVWLDCCHSGELLNFGEADPGDRGKGRDRCFIAASRAFEPAYEDPTTEHSILTRALLSGIDPSQFVDRWVTNLSLTDFITETLKREIQTPICNNSGEPIALTRRWQAIVEPPVATSEFAICPYKGLSYFDFTNDDYKYFYGRRALTDELLDKVRRAKFVAIVGASGSGKSSMLRAGLLHQLQVGQRIFGSDQWEIRLLVPGETPCRNLATAFVDDHLPRLERAEQQGKAEALIKEGADGLRRLVETAAGTRLVLVIDQFEEVFTLCQDASERDQFFATVLGALETTADRLCVIVAMRADFVGRCFEQDYSGLARQVQNHLIAVKPMSRDELSQAIVEPARQVELELEPELVTTLLDDVERSPGSLPLLQYALRELWEKRQHNRLQLATYIQGGAITGMLRQRADEVYAAFSEAQQQATKQIFLNLTQLGEGTEDTRRRVAQDSLVTAQHPQPLVDEVIQKLTAANLVVTSELVSKADGSRIAVVDVAHEALIRHWTQLRRWLEENRDLLRQQRKIEASAAEWREHRQQPGYLLQGLPLIEAKQFQTKHAKDFPLSMPASQFIQKSLRQRRINQLKTASWLIIPALIIVGVVEHNLRERQVAADLARLDQEGTYEEKRAVERLVAGCREQRPSRSDNQSTSWLPSYLAERLFGNCRSLARTPLSRFNLRNADLRVAVLRNAVLPDTILLSTNLQTARELVSSQMEGEAAPLLCNTQLPDNIQIDGDRDCDRLPQVLYGQYPWIFGSLEVAETYVNEQRLNWTQPN
jgi:energy-coupling factor transporter ATP-binding protein EcfA2